MSTTITTKDLDRGYEYEDTGLSENDALDRYTEEKARNPGAIVTIEGLDCGHHYRVKVYTSDREKGAYYNKKVRSLFDNIWDAIKS
ncbi:MAG TPA: hypothetical protein VI306_07510 [Pyrinomonadaceae bacterium]